MYMYLTAFGPFRHCAYDVGLVDWMADEFLGCLVIGWSFGCSSGCWSDLKINQKSIKNRSKNKQKSIKNGPKSDQNRSTELSWRGLGPSWPQDGPKSSKKAAKMKVLTSSRGPLWGPKSIKIWPKSDPRGDHFFDWFRDRFFERFGANLAPYWPPKPSQNGTKLASKSIQVGVLIWELFLEGCWHHFY